MKALRWILIGLAGLVVLIGVAGALALMPAVQTSLANKVLAGQPGLHITIGRVAAGFGGVKLENVSVTQPGLKFTLPSAEADFSLLSVVGKKLSVQKLVAKDWILDLTAPGAKPPPAGVPPTAAAAPAAVQAMATTFQGIFQRIQLPVDLAVKGVDVSGEAVFPVDPKQPPGHAKVTLTGGQLVANQDGRFDFQVDIALAGADMPVQAIVLRGALTARLETPRTFSSLGFTADATATGTQFPNGARVHAEASAQRAGDGEHYAAAVDAGSKRLLNLTADYPTGAPKLTGSWKLDVRDVDVAPFALGRPMPTFQATGSGKLESDAAFSAVHASGQLHASVEHLESIRAELNALGRLNIDSDFDLLQNGPTLRLDRLALVVAGAQPIAKLQTVQAFEFNAKTGELKVADPVKNLLQFDLQGLPLAWVRPFLPTLTVTGSDLKGTLVTRARDGGLHFESTAPFALENLSIAGNGRPLAHLDRAALEVSGDYTPQGWQAELTATGRDASKQIFSLQAKAGCLAGPKQPIKATGQFQADLPALLAQPALASSSIQLTRGTARAEFQANLDATKQFAAKLTIDDLASPQAQSLPSLAADMRAEIAPDGKITFEAPLVLKNADRKSDLTAAGTFQSASEGPAVDAHVTSTLLFVDDFKVLAAPFAAPAGQTPAPAETSSTPESSAQPAPSAPKRDTVPFWKGVSGHLTLALKKIVYGDNFSANDIAGDLKLGSDAISLEQGHAALGTGGEFKANGGITFAAAAPQPYSFKANIDVSGLDVGPLFKALDPSKPPTVEGKFDFKGQATGAGLNAADLAEHVQGEANLTSKSGIFRGLAKSNGAQVITGGLSLAGKELAAVGKITEALQQFPYDQINVQVVREQSLDVQLKDFSVISQQLRIVGTGGLTYAKGTPILNQKLALQIQLGVRGDFETLFNSIRKISTDQDELGYTKVSRPIKIGGTPAHPDTGDLYRFLIEGVGARAIERYLPKGTEQLLNIFGGKKK